jgi:hypothetical protein
MRRISEQWRIWGVRSQLQEKGNQVRVAFFNRPSFRPVTLLLVLAASSSAFAVLVPTAVGGSTMPELGTEEGTPAQAAQRSPRPPKLVDLIYGEWYGGIDGGPRFYLKATTQRASSTTFTARHRGRSSTARGVLNETRRKRELWKVTRKPAGRRVIRKIRRSFAEKGVARIRIVARGKGGYARRWVRFELADCTRDATPSYPVTCVTRF